MQYLEVQGDNPFYSPGNIALAMYQKPDVTRFGTREKWKTMGRSIMDSEVKNGFQIFSRASFGKGFILAPAYDISQTYGREVKAVRLENNTQAMEDALKTVLNYGMDCSGYVDWVFYNATGGEYIIGHGGGASAQHSYCNAISWDEALPGDLVFYPGDSHVGIVGGRDENGNLLIIHCASGANNVVITSADGFTSIGRPVYFAG